MLLKLGFCWVGIADIFFGDSNATLRKDVNLLRTTKLQQLGILEKKSVRHEKKIKMRYNKQEETSLATPCIPTPHLFQYLFFSFFFFLLTTQQRARLRYFHQKQGGHIP